MSSSDGGLDRFPPISPRHCERKRSNPVGRLNKKRLDCFVARAPRKDGVRFLGVGQGDSVCVLMRDDIAFIEAAYAVMRLGAYAVPVNWHFKPEEISYVLKDSGTRVLIGHAGPLCRGTAARGFRQAGCAIPIGRKRGGGSEVKILKCRLRDPYRPRAGRRI
jgi:AMP-binding enzyme